MDDTHSKQQPPIPIVAIGASAGGLEQISALLAEMPTDTGAAFVVLQHLAPAHNSQLGELLARATELAVVTIEHDMPIAADRVHVIPPGARLGIENDRFTLDYDHARTAVPTLIDCFFRDLAAVRAGAAAGIILSGTGQDGALGLKAIKANGGLALVQDPATAEQAGMPRAAQKACSADFVADTRALVEPLCNHLRHNIDRDWASAAQAPAENDKDQDHDSDADTDELGISTAQLNTILKVLRDNDSRKNFVNYKPGMLKRRIQRRMGLRGARALDSYADMLRQEPRERTALGQDFLITVTDFFREPRAYEALYEAITALLDERDASQPLRVWVPGCATGEEAYSIAILMAEAIEASGRDYGFIVFASDVDHRALEIARAGVYPESITAYVSEQRLGAFFNKLEGHYQVKRSLRERVVFAAQNVISDPPYSRLDLISCRNLLIYLTTESQQLVIELFHFALANAGLLFLGSAGTIGEAADLFEPLVAEHQVFKRTDVPQRRWLTLPERAPTDARVAKPRDTDTDTRPHTGDVERIARDMLLKEHVPAAVLVDRKLNILCSFGPATDYFALPFGASSLGLMDMVRAPFKSVLRVVVHRAFRDNTPSPTSAEAQDGHGGGLIISARPLSDPEAARGLLMITFEPTPGEQAPAGGDGSQSKRERELADELEATRDYLNNTIHALEASNEELKGSNEEVMSMNEELQSTNEELETSKEELQSINEELTTVNRELEYNYDQLESAHNDLQNLFAGADVATLFLDCELCVKRFTPQITQLLRLIESDTGRPLADLSLRFDDLDLLSDAEAVMRDLAPRDKEVEAHNGGWYKRRIFPYRTRDDRVEGVVITFADITEQKRVVLRAQETQTRIRVLADALAQLIAFVDRSGNLVFTNTACNEWFDVVGDDIAGREVAELLASDTYAAVKPAIDTALRGRATSRDIAIEHPRRGAHTLRVTLVPQSAEGQIRGFYALMTPVTEHNRRLGDQHEQQSDLAHVHRLATVGHMASTLAHDLNQPLAAINNYAEALTRSLHAGKPADQTTPMLRKIADQVDRASSIVDQTRAFVGRNTVSDDPIDLNGLVNDAVSLLDGRAKTLNVEIRRSMASALPATVGYRVQLEQVVVNLINNAFDAMESVDENARILWLTTETPDPGHLRLTVADSGEGIAADSIDQLFESFNTTKLAGMGMGLAISRAIAERHGGRLWAESEPGHGASFFLELPVTGDTGES